MCHNWSVAITFCFYSAQSRSITSPRQSIRNPDSGSQQLRVAHATHGTMLEHVRANPFPYGPRRPGYNDIDDVVIVKGLSSGGVSN